MAEALLSADLGATGRPTLSYLIEKAMCKLRAEGKHYPLNATATVQPTAHEISNLPRVPEDAILVTAERDSLKLKMLRTIRPLPLKYAWTFYHDKHSSSAADYESRLTVMMDEIVSIKPLWEIYNQFPLEALKTKDSVHFFKRGVKPLWEDPRNIAGGGWTFRVPRAQSLGIWKETLLLAVGEQFADVIQPGDDLCGVSFSVRFNCNLITIWNRDGSNQESIDGILTVILDNISPSLGLTRRSCVFYKKHSERAGFVEAIAAAKEPAGLVKSVEFS